MLRLLTTIAIIIAVITILIWGLHGLIGIIIAVPIGVIAGKLASYIKWKIKES